MTDGADGEALQRELSALASPAEASRVLRRVRRTCPERAAECLAPLVSALGRSAVRDAWVGAGWRSLGRAGHAFAPPPDVDTRPRVRAGVSPDGSRAAVRSGDQWCLLGFENEVAQALDADHVAWLGSRLVAARDRRIAVTDEGRDGSTTWWTAPSRVDGLLALATDHIAVEVRQLLGRDLFVLDGRAGADAPAPLATLSPALASSAAVPDGGFVCLDDGVQRTEVRFVWPDGRWLARTQHRNRVVAVATSPTGCLSLDRSGLLLSWSMTRGVPTVSGALELSVEPTAGDTDLCALRDGRNLAALIRVGSSLWHGSEVGSTALVVDGVVGLANTAVHVPNGSACALVALRDGWHRVDPATGGLWSGDRLPLALATEEEREALQQVTCDEVDFGRRVIE